MTTPDDHSDEIQRLEERGGLEPRTHTFARLADLYRKSGELDRALEVIESGLRHHPHYLNARLVHARLLRELGRSEEAVGAFERVLDIDSENLVAQAALAELAAESTGEVRSIELPHPRAPLSTGWLASLDAAWRVRAPSDEPVGDRALRAGYHDVETPAADSGPACPDPLEPVDHPGPRDRRGTGNGSQPVGGAESADGPEADGPEADGPEAGGPEAGGPERAGGPEPVHRPESSGEAEPLGPAESAVEPATEAVHPETGPGQSPRELETATLAELYVRQGLLSEAVGIYERLLARDPYNARLAQALEAARNGETVTSPVPEAESVSPEAEAVSRAPEAGPVSPEAGSVSPEADTRSSEPLPTMPPSPSSLEPPGSPPITMRAFLEALLEGEAEVDAARQGSIDWPEWLRRLGGVDR